MKRTAVALALGLAIVAAPAVAATHWATDPAHSRLTFTATQAGGEFEGRFVRFAPTIDFDPGDLAHSRFSVDVATGSADTGADDRDKTLKGKDFFAVDRWPTAHFESSGFERGATPGTFVATGRLTLRDATRAIRLPFTFHAAADGRSATLVGGTSIQRLDFGVGQGEWSDTQWVGSEVRIHFELALVAR